ncbi:MFS general substrate transporter [Aspergillus campestris IBT 28561]|uniref:MFS general substrate transporter n=1 Tax=Aspergillus campestris (strain IBT 28561) TaxID=1392248 RepID=A0A2I1CSC0_ASPC2|nr:MFS general substrate transporter [Aspergillus campestris IBT 28561]PKY00526.1 MFS general substrate transporter [Aspergillus campestris IBT 28561]
MSLPRVSYLESWVQNPTSFFQRQRDENIESDSEDELGQDLPDDSLSSSFHSNFSYPVGLRHRVNFNPYAGPGWTEAVDDGTDDRQSLLGASTPRPVGVDGAVGQEGEQPLDLDVQEGVLETRGAFEVSRLKRILQVIVAVIYCFFSAGIVFGFAAIKPVLIQEGVYRDKCGQEEIEQNQEVCYGQELRLNLMFTIAAVVTNVSALPVGTILDIYGPRVCGVIGSMCLIIGALSFGLATSVPFDTYIPGYLFLSLGGPFIFISSFHLSNTFPTHSGLILSTLTGAFDASSAVFLLFRLANQSTHGSFTSRKFFMLYLIVPIFILTVQSTIMPVTSYKTAGELVQEAEAHIAAEAHDTVDDRIRDPGEGERQRNHRREKRHNVVSKIRRLLTHSNDGDALEEPTILKTSPSTVPDSPSGIWGVMHGYSALRQIQSPWFILIMLFTVLQMLRINYFVATIRQQYEYLLHSHAAARRLNETFDFLLPVGGLLSIPFIGAILDNASTPFVLLLLVTTATTIGILGCIPHSLEASYANIILFVLYRPFYYTAVSDYAAKVFGFQTFGKVYGLIICLAGIGNFAQAGLDALTFKTFHRNPIPVNAVLTGVTCGVGLALVSFVWWRAKIISSPPPTTTTTTEAVLEPGPPPPAAVPAGEAVVVRDWEREPLLQTRVRVPAGRRPSPSYGIASSA